MNRLHNVWKLPMADKLMLVKMFFLLAAIKVGLALLSFQQLRGLLDRLAVSFGKRRANDLPEQQRIVWAATVAGVALLGSKACLAQALAVQFLYHRRGQPAQLCIGVRRDPKGGLQAHAWVESQGQTVIGGGQSLLAYTPFPSLDRGAHEWDCRPL
jgi:hypothetical protein